MTSGPAAVPQGGDAKGSSWKPYVIGFGIGAVILTVMPLLQRQFLKAPAPIAQLTPWAGTTLQGTPLGSTALAGKVVLATAELGPCAADCVERQQRFGTALQHVDDLKGTPVELVTFVGPGAKDGLGALGQAAPGTWHFVDAPAQTLNELQSALDAFLGGTRTLYPQSHALVLIDQNGAVRGFWKDEPQGHGNAINAARLLAKYGAAP